MAGKSAHAFSQEDGVSLRTYFERIIADYQESNATALALEKAEIQRRLDILNGEAGRIKEVQDTTMPRNVADLKFGHIDDRLRILELSKAAVDGKASQSSLIFTMAFTVFSVLISLCGLSVSVTLAIRLFLQ